MKPAQRLLLIPFGLCALLLLGVVIWEVFHGQRLAALEKRRHVLVYQVQLLRLVVADLLDAETGQRGFLLTQGKLPYLEPYVRAKISIQENFSELYRLFKDEPLRLAQLREIENIANLKLLELEDTIAAFRRGDRAGVMRTLETDRGRKYMDDLRLRLAEVIGILTTERANIGVEATERIGQVRTGLIGMSTLICAILVLVYFLVSRAEQARAKFAARLEYAANHDALTGLPNRHYLKAYFGEMLRSANEKRLRLALFYIDLDNFKSVNDKYGHDAGDSVLQEAAHVMERLIGDQATLLRLGGDEFALIYAPAPADAVLARLASDMIHDLSEVKLGDGTPSEISASIGVALFPENSGSETDLFHAADAAMYRAKNAGKARFAFADIKQS